MTKQRTKEQQAAMLKQAVEHYFLAASSGDRTKTATAVGVLIVTAWRVNDLPFTQIARIIGGVVEGKIDRERMDNILAYFDTLEGGVADDKRAA